MKTDQYHSTQDGFKKSLNFQVQQTDGVTISPDTATQHHQIIHSSRCASTSSKRSTAPCRPVSEPRTSHIQPIRRSFHHQYQSHSIQPYRRQWPSSPTFPPKLSTRSYTTSSATAMWFTYNDGEKLCKLFRASDRIHAIALAAFGHSEPGSSDRWKCRVGTVARRVQSDKMKGILKDTWEVLFEGFNERMRGKKRKARGARRGRSRLSAWLADTDGMRSGRPV